MCFSIRQIDPHRPKPGLARRRIRLFSHAQIVQKKDPDTFDPRRNLPLTARFVISLMRSKRRGKKKQDRFGKGTLCRRLFTPDAKASNQRHLVRDLVP